MFLLGAAKRQENETERGFLFNLRGLFLQSMGFPFDSQGPGSSRKFLLLLSHYKAIKNSNQSLLSAIVIRTCGKTDVLGSKCVTYSWRSGRIMLKPGTSPRSDQVRMVSTEEVF